VSRNTVTRDDVWIEVLTQGQGHPIVLLPSLGRGATDFDAIAERLAAASFRVLRPQPRGIGASRGAMTGINLHTYAADIAAVIEHDRTMMQPARPLPHSAALHAGYRRGSPISLIFSLLGAPLVAQSGHLVGTCWEPS
jgi:pimeloyl-ACP methyl ester carboxylesterase